MYIALVPKNKQINQGKELFNFGTKKVIVSEPILFSEVLNTPNIWCGYIGNSGNQFDKGIVLEAENELVQNLKNNLFGAYMLVLVNKKDGSMSFLRDPAGIQHAYYIANEKECFLSTSIDELISLNGRRSLDLDRKAIELYLTFQYVPSPFTLVKGVSQVPLNVLVKYKDGQLIQTKQKNKIFEHEFKKENSGKNYLLNILSNSISEQKISSFKNPGAFLSGGMDTTTNISLLVTQFNIKPTVFTAVFEHSTYSELEYAELVAKKFSLKHHVVEIGPESIQCLGDMVSVFDNPVADRAALAQYIISEKANSIDVDVMISGEGGDEILGYPRNLPEHFVPGDELSSQDLATLYLSYSALNQSEAINELFGKKSQKIETNGYLAELYESLTTSSSFEKIYYGQWQTWLIDNVFMKDHQIFKHFSLGYIAPFINEKLMSHMVDQSQYKKPALLKNKYYLKASLKEILLQEVIEKKKQKFEVPISNWIKGSLKNYLSEELIHGDQPIFKYIDKKALTNLFDKHISGEQDNNRQLWALLVLNLWYKSKISKL